MKDNALVLKNLPLVLAADGTIPEWIQVCPAGQVQSTKGDFLVDTEAFKAVQNAFKTLGHDLVTDYEHQTLGGEWASPDGTAPAAAWIQELQLRDDGLYARMSWTERAAGMVARREYRFVSPVVRVRKADRRLVGIHSVGLTNDPAIRGGRAIANSAGHKGQEDGRMDELRKKAIELLALRAEATDDEIVAALTGLKDLGAEAVKVLELKAGTASELKATVLALKARAGGPSQEEYLALKRRLDQHDADGLVTAAIAAGKITPAQRPWAEQYALSDKAGFQKYVELAPVVVDMGRVAGEKRPAAVEPLSAEDVAACKALGITEDQFKAARKAELEEVA